MFSLDLPDMPPSPAIVIAANAEAQKARRTERIMGVCMPTPYVAPGSAPNVRAASMSGPNSWARDYLSIYEKVELGLPPMSSVEIVKAPKHVTLVFDKSYGGDDVMYFVPNPGYVGRDYAELRVNVEGRVVKLAYYIHVTKADLDARGGRPKFCPKEPVWKISMSESAAMSALLGPSLFDTAATSGITLNFADLPGTAVGQATGTTITLDTNAAGNGWFIDPTPSLNEEWLPTSNPNEWKAKIGSAAYGKMDMLSVRVGPISVA